MLNVFLCRNITTNSPMSVFASNLELLKAVKLEQPAFWDHLKLIATALERSKFYFMDDHSDKISEEPTNHLVLVQKINKGKIRVGEPSEYNKEHPLAWVTSFE